MGDDGV